MQDAAVATNTLESLFADVHDQDGSLQSVVAVRHDDDLDTRQRGRVEDVPVGNDERIADLPGNRVDDEHGPQSEHDVLALPDDLFQYAFADNIFC